MERILEDVLDLRILWNSIPEPPGQSILAALEPATKTVVFNESSRALIDETQGLYNTVLAHEAGHWEAHVDHGQLAQRSLPDFDGSLPNLQSLDLSGNQLSGEIPPQLGSLFNLQLLHLSENQLSSEIPSELGSLANLQWLFLQRNQLSGCVPQGLSGIPETDLGTLGLPPCETRAAVAVGGSGLRRHHYATSAEAMQSVQ